MVREPDCTYAVGSCRSEDHISPLFYLVYHIQILKSIIKMYKEKQAINYFYVMNIFFIIVSKKNLLLKIHFLYYKKVVAIRQQPKVWEIFLFY